jgi:hypothetical protein
MAHMSVFGRTGQLQGNAAKVIGSHVFQTDAAISSADTSLICVAIYHL